MDINPANNAGANGLSNTLPNVLLAIVSRLRCDVKGAKVSLESLSNELGSPLMLPGCSVNEWEEVDRRDNGCSFIFVHDAS